MILAHILLLSSASHLSTASASEVDGSLPRPAALQRSAADAAGGAAARTSRAPRIEAREGVDGRKLAEFARGRRRLLERLASRLELPLDPSRFPSYELFSDLVQKGVHTGSTDPVDPPDAQGRIRRVHDLPCSARDGEAEAAWLLRVSLGQDALPVWSVGLAAIEAPAVYGRPAGALAGALAHSGLFPDLEETIDSPSELRQYPTLFVPAARVLVGWILDRHGAETLRRAVLATSRARDRLRALSLALGVPREELRKAYRAALAAQARSHPRALVRGQAGLPSGRQRGVCYAHTVSLRRGYASVPAARQLDRLKGMGVNWVSVTPFAYLKPHEPRIVASSGFGSEGETDESMAVVIHEVRRRGLGVLLKPHLWSHGFVGRISMRSEGDWRRFFREYGRYVVHNAVLGEACGASALCVGNELIEATRGRDAEWRRIIAAVRSVFAGPLTYGAHWDREVEQIGFWDALDWVGVSLYAPLATSGAAGPEAWAEEARRQALRLGAIARRVNRPLVLVEVGFPSHPQAALKPWEDPDGGPADPQAQAAAYEALLSAFWPQPFLGGVYWWKWFSDEPAPAGDRSHRFAGKPAEEVVRRFYLAH
ncbi:MAG: hypothetical protein V3U98_02050 [Acidobacteriota bacterium]